MLISTVHELGPMIKATRKMLGLTQQDLAMSSGTGIRFISDLENGKATCELGKTLHILSMLGFKVDIQNPKKDL